MTRAEATEKLARALTRAAAEHGVPNTFGVAELVAFYGAPGADWSYKIGRETADVTCLRCPALWKAMGGREKFPTAPRYNRGSFIL